MGRYGCCVLLLHCDICVGAAAAVCPKSRIMRLLLVLMLRLLLLLLLLLRSLLQSTLPCMQRAPGMAEPVEHADNMQHISMMAS